MAKQDSSFPFSHFDGPAGKRRLLDAVRAQGIVGQDAALAKAIVRVGHLEKHPARKFLMIQGAADNDLWLIVSGAVSIRINGREVATRQAGTHVGEMALIEALSKRSASVLTLEPTITLKLSEPVFSRLAKTTPELWRRVAAEIATRLRERSKFVRAPNNQPVLFLGSSTEGLTVAETLNDRFRKQPVVSRLWTLGVFQPSSTAIESLVKIAGLADFAIFVLTADDVTFSRRKKQQSPRDNVIFELGLFIGAIGRDRVVILKPKNCQIKMPSDLAGVVWLEYARGGNTTLKARLASAYGELRKLVKTHGSR